MTTFIYTFIINITSDYKETTIKTFVQEATQHIATNLNTSISSIILIILAIVFLLLLTIINAMILSAIIEYYLLKKTEKLTFKKLFIKAKKKFNSLYSHFALIKYLQYTKPS